MVAPTKKKETRQHSSTAETYDYEREGSVIYFNSGKFRIMTSRDAFIPEYSSNLINFLEPSDLHFINGTHKLASK
jgi:hypothetical protein